MTEELNAHIEKRYLECHKRSQGLSYGSFYDGYVDCYYEQQKNNAEAAETIKQLQNKIKQNEDLATIAYMQGASKKQKQAAEIIGGLLEIVDGLGNFSGGVFNRAREFVEAAK